MSKIFIPLLFAVILIACAGNPSASSQPEEKQAAPATQASVSSDHPCDMLPAVAVASTLGLDPAAITISKEDLGEAVCLYTSSEITEEEDESIDFFYFAIQQNKDGFPNYENALNNMISKGSTTVPAGPDKGKDIPVRKVEGIGNNAVIYSAADYSTLTFHKDNKARYSLTLYRNVPGNFVFNGLDMSSEELEAKLVELGKAMN